MRDTVHLPWGRPGSRSPEEDTVLQFMRDVMRARKEDGASAVEYGLLVAAIAALIVIVVFALGGIVKKVFSKTCNEVGSGASVGTTNCGG
jgi:pilus assembly protein Flp/PilA